MIIGKYIRQLLNDRQRVVLPGFGSLEVKEISGELSKSGGKINPPGLSVKFDKGFSKDDGLLAASLSAGEGMEEEEARQRILEMIDAVKFSLDKGESYTLLETGTLWKDDDGKVHFQAASDWVLEPDQYGLESLDLLELEELPIEEEEKAEATEILLDIPERPVKRQVAKASHRPMDKQAAEKSSRRIKRWRAIWMVAGILVVILAVLIFIPKKKPPLEVINQIENQQVQEIETETATPVPDQPTPDAEVSGQEQMELRLNFHIIAGSFKHLINASDKQDDLKARGYPAEVMITENRMYRVSVGSYATEGDAGRALSALKSEPGLESCWILSN